MVGNAKNKNQSTFSILRVLNNIPLVSTIVRAFHHVNTQSLAVNRFGIDFLHPVGVAAGVDKKGELYNIMADYGPSFIEIGPLQDVKPAIAMLKDDHQEVPVFANLAGNKLEASFSLIYDFVDAVVFNIFNATTFDRVEHILTLRQYNDNYLPIIFKINTDMTEEKLTEVIRYMLMSGIDGIMVPKSYVSRAIEISNGLLPVIVYGVFEKKEDVAEYLDKGACLAAVSNNPVRYGANFIKRILKYLCNR